MRHLSVDPQEGFRVIARSGRSQAATMVLSPGGSTGGPDNRHPGSDQWLLVLSGSGEAIVAGETVPLETNTLLLVEAGETHEILNTGEQALRTLNFYAPPAY